MRKFSVARIWNNYCTRIRTLAHAMLRHCDRTREVARPVERAAEGGSGCATGRTY
jgi:hypothetical protein